MATWRVGRKVGRTLYCDNVLAGLMDTPEQAAEVVAALEAHARLESENAQLRAAIRESDHENGYCRFTEAQQFRKISDCTPENCIWTRCEGSGE